MYSFFGPFGASIKKTLYIELRYPLNFITGTATVFIMGTWFILSALAFSNGTAPSQNSNNNLILSFAIWGIIFFYFSGEIFWGVSNFVNREQRQGTLEQLYLSSTKPQVVLLGGAVGSIIIAALFNLVVIIGFSFVIKLPIQNFFLSLYVLIISIILMIGMSLIFGAVILRVKRGQMIINFSQFIFMILCGIFFPFAALPPTLRSLSLLIPLSYAIDMFRSTIMGTIPELFGFGDFTTISPLFTTYFVEFIWLHFLAVILFGCGWKFYGWMEKNILEKQGLGQY
jgi:ABC-2 type transport system permease protein